MPLARPLPQLPRCIPLAEDVVQFLFFLEGVHNSKPSNSPAAVPQSVGGTAPAKRIIAIDEYVGLAHGLDILNQAET
jgi:hypothetical protein